MIKAEIVAHSLSPQGNELITVLATFPRIILAEVNTHRMLSKNTSSSRAIPFNKMVEAVRTNPFIPIAWQKHHSGMQGTEYFNEKETFNQINRWIEARDKTIEQAELLYNLGTTKQICNRLLEPFMWTTMLITGSKEGWENFFHLRCPDYQFDIEFSNETATHNYKSRKDALNDGLGSLTDLDEIGWLQTNKGQAEIHIMDLAEKIWDARNESTPKQLKPGEWHIPFKDKIDTIAISNKSYRTYHTKLGMTDTQFNIIKTSVSMAARTSYTVVGEEKEINYENMFALHDRLLTQEPPHSSPFEHTARAMSDNEYKSTYRQIDVETKGNHTIKENGWCYNLKGFIPYRYLVDNKLEL